MYISILPAISTEGESIRGNMLSIKEPPLPGRENVHTKMLHLMIQNGKTYKTKKGKKKKTKTTVQYAGEYISMPKKP